MIFAIRKHPLCCIHCGPWDPIRLGAATGGGRGDQQVGKNSNGENVYLAYEIVSYPILDNEKCVRLCTALRVVLSTSKAAALFGKTQFHKRRPAASLRARCPSIKAPTSAPSLSDVSLQISACSGYPPQQRRSDIDVLRPKQALSILHLRRPETPSHQARWPQTFVRTSSTVYLLELLMESITLNS